MPQAELVALEERLVELNDQAQDLIAGADAEKRDVNEDEQTQVDALNAEFEWTKTSVESRKKVNDNQAILEASQGRKTEPMPIRTNSPGPVGEGTEPTQTRGRVAATPVTLHGKCGWRTFGDFANDVRMSCSPGGVLSQKLVDLHRRTGPTTFGAEGVGADGGHAVPPDFRDEILTMITGEASLLARTDQMISSTNVISFPKDETTPWSGGVTAYWDGEGLQATQSKPLVEKKVIQLDKMRVLVGLTDELLADAPALGTWLRKKAPQKMDFKLNLAIVQGTGVGQPLGILNSGCLISVAKEGAQAADTVVFNNIIKMWARMYGPSRANAVWLINQDIEPQLFVMSFEGTSSSVPAYMPANGLSASPYGTLMGRPVIPTQACNTLGDKGDIIFADLSQYLTATKSGGIRAETSIHLWFDYDVQAFKFVWRIAGQPWWGAAMSPRAGSNTLSPFVTLAERA